MEFETCDASTRMLLCADGFVFVSWRRLDKCTTEEERHEVRMSQRLVEDEGKQEERWKYYFGEYAEGLERSEREAAWGGKDRMTKRQMAREKRKEEQESEDADYREALARENAEAKYKGGKGRGEKRVEEGRGAGSMWGDDDDGDGHAESIADDGGEDEGLSEDSGAGG